MSNEPILLCRTADSLYWAGRYLERVESLARLITEHTALLVDLPRRVELTWQPLLAIPGGDHGFWERYDTADEVSVMEFLLTDRTNECSLAYSIDQARENLRTVRQVFPRTSWRLVNELAQVVESQGTTSHRRGRRHQLLERVVGDCQRMAGVIHDAMRRDHAYDFFHLGTQFERADMTTRVLDVRAASIMELNDELASEAGREEAGAKAVFEDIQWLGVLRSLVGVHSYRRSTSDPVTGPDVVRFLLTDDRFPRSIAFCLDEIDTSLQNLPKNLPVVEACHDARVLLGRVDAMTWRAEQLRDLADDVQLGLAGIDDALKATYFTDDDILVLPPPSSSQSQSQSQSQSGSNGSSQTQSQSQSQGRVG